MAKNKVKLQTVRGLSIYPKSHPKIKKLQQKAGFPEIHGDKVWFSSYFIMDWLDAHPPAPKSRILEVGCGWGVLGMYCAKNYDAKVTGTDADKNVFPFLKLHAEKNDIKIKTKVARYEKLKQDYLAKFDVLVGGDICFWDELVDPLLELIDNAVKAGVPRIIIADPGRPPFLKLARKCRKLYKGSIRSVSISKPRAHTGNLLVINTPGRKNPR